MHITQRIILIIKGNVNTRPGKSQDLWGQAQKCGCGKGLKNMSRISIKERITKLVVHFFYCKHAVNAVKCNCALQDMAD